MYVPPELVASPTQVLFVDAQGHVLGAMKRAMKAFAGEVEFVTAQTGIEALLKVGSQRPQVLVIDTDLPGLDAVAVVEQLKANPDTEWIQIILLAEKVTPELEKKALALGAKAVRAKSLSAEDLLALVKARPGAK